MTIKLGIVLLGALLIYAGWTNKSVSALILGDNTVTKSGSSWPSSPSSPGAAGSASQGGTSAAGASPNSGASAAANSGQVQRNVNAG